MSDGPYIPFGRREFWSRQFRPEKTVRQVVFDVLFGIVAPVLCLIFDPVVFRDGNTLNRVAVFGYFAITIGIIALGWHLAARRTPAFVSGALFAGATLALVIGILIFPLALSSALLLIGIPGFTPLMTAFVFIRNARRSWSVSVQRQRPHYALALLGFSLSFVVPYMAQAGVSNTVTHAIAVLKYGPESDVHRAAKTLKLLHMGTREIEEEYFQTRDIARRKRLADAYLIITGRDMPEYVSD